MRPSSALSGPVMLVWEFIMHPKQGYILDQPNPQLADGGFYQVKYQDNIQLSPLHIWYKYVVFYFFTLLLQNENCFFCSFILQFLGITSRTAKCIQLYSWEYSLSTWKKHPKDKTASWCFYTTILWNKLKELYVCIIYPGNKVVTLTKSNNSRY